MLLNEMEVGETARIISVGGEPELHRRLIEMGLIPGTAIIAGKRAPLGNPMEITVRGYVLTLRLEDARLIEVTGETNKL